MLWLRFIRIHLLMWGVDLIEVLISNYLSHIWLGWLVHYVSWVEEMNFLNSLLIRKVNTNDGHSKMISALYHVETHHTFVLCHFRAGVFLSNCSLSIRERHCQFSPVCSRTGFGWHCFLYSPGVSQHLSEMSLVLWCPLLCSLTDCIHSRQNISNRSTRALL